MTAFLLAVLLLVATALLFVLPPLLRKEQDGVAQVQLHELNLRVLRDQLRELEADLAAGSIDPAAFASARQELERRVVQEALPADAAPQMRRAGRRAAATVGLAVPLGSMVLYVLLGAPLALDPIQAGASPHAETPDQIGDMVAGLAQRLRSQPDNVEGWEMLARSYNALGRHKEASDAYAHLVALRPNDAGLLADYADTLAMTLNRSLQGMPEELVNRALAVDPDNLKALALSGTAAFERGDYAAAVERWQRIIALAPPASEIARSTADSISEAKQMLAQRPQPASAPLGARVEGIVELDPVLRAQVADTDTVFIYARAAAGPRVPLAVLRKRVADLPLSFVLDDSMGMMPDMKLSDFPSVVVQARISRSGSATPRPGEPEGMSEVVGPVASNVKIRIRPSQR